ncbi:MAG: hypothetical protein LUE25_06510 [Clostridiales bacterium]|nr:hypothetical protein [Clostridiales bacterium]
MKKSKKIVVAAFSVTALLIAVFLLYTYHSWLNDSVEENDIVGFGFYIAVICSLYFIFTWISIGDDVVYYLIDKSNKTPFETILHIISTISAAYLFVLGVYLLDSAGVLSLGNTVLYAFKILFPESGIYILIAVAFGAALPIIKIVSFIIRLTRRSIKTRKIIKAYEAEHTSDSCEL